MVEIITENTPLLEELRQLLIKEDKKKDARLTERIEQLRSEITNNIRKRISALKAEPIIVRTPHEEPQLNAEGMSNSKAYKQLLAMYREAMQIAKECSMLKKTMRESNGK